MKVLQPPQRSWRPRLALRLGGRVLAAVFLVALPALVLTAGADASTLSWLSPTNSGSVGLGAQDDVGQTLGPLLLAQADDPTGPEAQDATSDGTLPYRVLAMAMASLSALLGVMTLWYWRATMPPARRGYLPPATADAQSREVSASSTHVADGPDSSPRVDSAMTSRSTELPPSDIDIPVERTG